MRPALCGFFLALLPAALPAQTLIGVLGGTGVASADAGAVVSIDPMTGAATALGIPIPGESLTGVAQLADGRVVASTAGFVGDSSLIEINPETGALVATIGPVLNGQDNIVIHDLAVDSAGNLYGVSIGVGTRRNGDQRGQGHAGSLQGPGPLDENALFTIDTTDGTTVYVGTIVNPTGGFVALAFGADGTLYGKPLNSPDLYTIDTATASILTTVAVNPSLGALGLGSLANGDLVMIECCAANNVLGPPPIGNEVFSIDPATGNAVSIGLSGSDRRVHDVTIVGVPTPTVEVPTLGSVGLWLLIGLVGLVGAFLLRR
jgi:hypothetical protein